MQVETLKNATLVTINQIKNYSKINFYQFIFNFFQLFFNQFNVVKALIINYKNE